jgi:hypothetical protein
MADLESDDFSFADPILKTPGSMRKRINSPKKKDDIKKRRKQKDLSSE